MSDASLYELLSVSPSADGGGWLFVLRFPEGSAGFAGHFPDMPVLPAVVQLDVVAELVSARAADSGALRAVASARFLEPVVPGDRVEVTVGAVSPAGRRTFRIERDGRVVSRGALDWEGTGA